MEHMCDNSGAVRTSLTRPDGTSVLVRPVTEKDIPRLQAFERDLSEESRELFTPHPYDDATLEEVVERARTGQDRVYVAMADGRVVGYFFLWHMDHPVPILGIGIVDAYQGQGLGKQFMRLLIEDAREEGRDGIDLTTMQRNDRAFSLYRKVGFDYVGDVKNVAGDGRVVCERRMFLPLKPAAEPPERDFQSPV
jgi:ribosomal protein S18 acetylase RimI-like enzyme